MYKGICQFECIKEASGESKTETGVAWLWGVGEQGGKHWTTVYLHPEDL